MWPSFSLWTKINQFFIRTIIQIFHCEGWCRRKGEFVPIGAGCPPSIEGLESLIDSSIRNRKNFTKHFREFFLFDEIGWTVTFVFWYRFRCRHQFLVIVGIKHKLSSITHRQILRRERGRRRGPFRIVIASILVQHAGQVATQRLQFTNIFV